MKLLFLSFLFMVSFSTCKNTSTPEEQAKPMTLPETPIAVAQEWVEAFYKDEFPKAALLSTELTRVMIDSVIKEMQANVPYIPFTVTDMACEVKGDSAICTFVYNEEEDQYEEYVNLIKINGQWLVNESWDSSSEADEDYELMPEELEEMMEGKAGFDNN